jgi:hypothetical protein
MLAPYAAYPSGQMGQDRTPPGVALGGGAALAEMSINHNATFPPTTGRNCVI